MKNKYWLILLSDVLKQKKTGLTIPYLVGCYHLTGHNDFAIKDLLLDFQRNDNTPKVIIRYCNKVNDFVATINESFLYGIENRSNNFDNLYLVNSNWLQGISEFDDYVTVFNIYYSKFIAKNYYSKEGDNYIEFRKDQKAVIIDLLKIE